MSSVPSKEKKRITGECEKMLHCRFYYFQREKRVTITSVYIDFIQYRKYYENRGGDRQGNIFATIVVSILVSFCYHYIVIFQQQI